MLCGLSMAVTILATVGWRALGLRACAGLAALQIAHTAPVQRSAVEDHGAVLPSRKRGTPLQSFRACRLPLGVVARCTVTSWPLLS
ncbi:hypothetical protein BGW36DRAFT_124176 [Talaromyces proteolyticus]|uniref:Secreted protein n=1 Tax=Talaromyces proteolyticus TaxID=1131652 RepID=A0AAD4KSM9_9EURO|nr:uncharacterized protein BGW36DRAFT_124176 [Talaromyces proteolyticus]KAH8700182.1 hypothetical protein BGW36DRAFT_124176 [Talaromyces proteolyticus]